MVFKSYYFFVIKFYFLYFLGYILFNDGSDELDSYVSILWFYFIDRFGKGRFFWVFIFIGFM